MSSDPLQNLPSTTTAFTNTLGPRRLLSSSSSSTKRVVTSIAFTSSTETPEVLLLAGRDPECRQRVRFNGTQVRLRFLEEARGINVVKEEKEKEGEGKEGKKVVVEDRQDVRDGEREQSDERPRKRPKRTGGGVRA